LVSKKVRQDTFKVPKTEMSRSYLIITAGHFLSLQTTLNLNLNLTKVSHLSLISHLVKATKLVT